MKKFLVLILAIVGFLFSAPAMAQDEYVFEHEVVRTNALWLTEWVRAETPANISLEGEHFRLSIEFETHVSGPIKKSVVLSVASDSTGVVRFVNLQKTEFSIVTALVRRFAKDNSIPQWYKKWGITEEEGRKIADEGELILALSKPKK